MFHQIALSKPCAPFAPPKEHMKVAIYPQLCQQSVSSNFRIFANFIGEHKFVIFMNVKLSPHFSFFSSICEGEFNRYLIIWMIGLVSY